jgi:hypothetical protein
VVTKRTRPLTASDGAAPVSVLDAAGAEDDTTDHGDGDAAGIEIAHVTPVVAQIPEDVRRQRFADGIRGLRVGGGTLKLNERILMVLGGVIAPLGVLVVLLGWIGASHTPYTFEQIPYLISGGLLGLGLIFLGSFFYFTHWLTELVKEHRAQSSAIIEALQRLQDELTFQAGADRAASVSSNGSAAALVTTPRGSMAHRPECVIVAGKPSLKAVSAADGLEPCKLCDPYVEVST